MFTGSLILQHDKSAFQTLLNTWCGTPKQWWRLVFRASTHGYSAQAFHSHCDGVAPLLVLVQLSRGEVMGGFTDVAWARAGGAGVGGYISSERAFLFVLSEPPARYPVTKKAFAICYHPDCGPVFGAGADLFISSNCNANSESYSNLHSYGEGALPAAAPPPPASLSPDYNFTVRDYEVFTPNVPAAMPI
ncbi:TBC1 domain family member 24 [Eumeta japonica]|uniref:TBC1 domain family member 24 n=1 Tax=Eumeta variegata TaxID=151549 RepID=A0A4C1TPF3_EUMVA|nr:TBC1 domain family member 24 [Eumeta japonica]